MSLKEQIRLDMIDAMRSGDTDKRDALRYIMSAIKQVEVDERRELSDEDVVAVLTKQAKQRRESIADYQTAGRDDLVHEEQAQLALIESYLPAQMSRDEIEEIASRVIADAAAAGPPSTGQVMGKLMPLLKGKADGRLVNEVVRELLQS